MCNSGEAPLGVRAAAAEPLREGTTTALRAHVLLRAASTPRYLSHTHSHTNPIKRDDGWLISSLCSLILAPVIPFELNLSVSRRSKFTSSLSLLMDYLVKELSGLSCHEV